VSIQDSALIAAATLSNRYIADRFLPDKAIDLVDEAASKIRIEIDSLPTEIDEVKRRTTQLKIELESLRKEKDDSAKQRRKAIEQEVAELEAREYEMTKQWQVAPAGAAMSSAWRAGLNLRLTVRYTAAGRAGVTNPRGGNDARPPDLLAVAMKHGQHQPLRPLQGLSVIVAV
jgi:ATP-dependent Clp protease ATP-binding subunit ClpB